MKAKELISKDQAELVELEKKLSRDLWKARFDNFNNQLDQTHQIRSLRRDIARVKTVLNQSSAKAAAQSK